MEKLQPPGIEPGSKPWEGSIMPLDHGCLGALLLRRRRGRRKLARRRRRARVQKVIETLALWVLDSFHTNKVQKL